MLCGAPLTLYRALAQRVDLVRTERGATGRLAALRAWRPRPWTTWPALAFLLFFAYGMAFIWGNYLFLDLRVYMGSAHEFFVGNDPYSYNFTFVNLYPTYPPFALAVLSPLSVVPVHVMIYLWSLASLACLAFLFSVVLGEVGPPAWAGVGRYWRVLLSLLLALVAVIAIQPVRSNFGFGQINVFLITMNTFDVLRRRRRSRGVLIGLASAIKFTPLIFVLLLVLERDWRAVGRSIGAFVAATALVWAVAPGASAYYFLHFSTMEKRIGTPTYVSDQSINGILHRLGFSGAGATLAWLVLSVIVLLVAAMVARRLLDDGASMLLVLLVMATAGLLVSPISWDHHWSWVALFPLALLDKSLRRLVTVALLAVITVAVAAFYWWHYAQGQGYGIPTGPFTPLADDSLAIAGIAFLASWAWVLRKEISLRDLSPSVLLMKPVQLPPNLARPPAEPPRVPPTSGTPTSATPTSGPRASGLPTLGLPTAGPRASLDRRQRWRRNTSPSRRRAFERPE